MKNISKVIACFGLLSALTLGLSACNTVKGIGQDFSALGNSITSASNDASQTRGY